MLAANTALALGGENGSLPNFVCQDPILWFEALDSDLLDCLTQAICDSSDLQMAFWWHKEAHSGYLLASAESFLE